MAAGQIAPAVNKDFNIGGATIAEGEVIDTAYQLSGGSEDKVELAKLTDSSKGLEDQQLKSQKSLVNIEENDTLDKRNDSIEDEAPGMGDTFKLSLDETGKLQEV